VDEAHRLKNFNCRLIRELRSLRTENRLLLTGTPLQNSLTELWSLLNFILPDIFDSLDNFQSWFDFDEVIIKGDTEGNAVEESKDSISEQLVQKLHNILQPFLLRRLKHDVELSLPKKREYILYCPFMPAQKAFYNLLKQHDWKKIVAGSKFNSLNLSLAVIY
jgi:ATP-dependent DNA helicase